MSSTIAIPAEQVQFVRSGLYTDLRDSLEETCSVIEASHRESEDARALCEASFRHIDGARALLAVIGWATPTGEQEPVEIDLREHRSALVRALRALIEAERGLSASLDPTDNERGTVRARITGMVDLIERAEESGA